MQELVKLHGGSIGIDSELGRGTTLTISIPLGSQHLPHDQVGNGSSAVHGTTTANAFIEEALCSLPDAAGYAAVGAEPPAWQGALAVRARIARTR